ncbi:MAG: GatB/YqeY domain-containing protein [Bacilli bacterium]
MLETFNNDLIIAMKEQNKFKLAVLRMVKGAMQLEVINKKIEYSNDLLLDIISKQIKTRNESIIEFEKGNRLDLIEQNKKEIEILKTYLPKQVTEAEAIEIIDKIFLEIKPTSMKDMGSIMAMASKELKGKFDSKRLSEIIKNKLMNL